MKKINGLPDFFEDYDKEGILGSSEYIDMDELEMFDKQIKGFGLEVTVFENGAATCWIVTRI